MLIDTSGTFLSLCRSGENSCPMPFRRPLLILALTAFCIAARAQDAPPAMMPPMDIPLLLAGNFMELRSGHFHSGIDIKTNGAEGLPVKAVKAGFVSRIKISPWGYGKALYLQHPDGTTTVYGHLSGFAPAIAAAALEAQYAAKDFSIDHYPAERINVAQGEVIAYSGNTGGSTAPHLHFEVRRTADQHALDPESHGIDLADKTAPEILGVRIYPLDSTSRVSPYPGKARGFAAELNGSIHTLAPEVKVAGYGTVGIAVHTIDRYDGTSNKCGVRKIQLLVDDVPAFSVALDEIDFDVNRYCDAHMDYAQYKDLDLHYHRLYKLPNNPLAIYGQEPAQGRIELVPGKARTVRVLVTDAHGNLSQLQFPIDGATRTTAATWPAADRTGTHFAYDRENRFGRDDLRLVVPPKALYEDLYFHYERRKTPMRAGSALHMLHNNLTPLNKPFELSIKADSVPAALAQKAVIVRYDGPGKYTAQGGCTWNNGWVSASVRNFGSYTVLVDTVAPRITPIDLKPDLSARKSFSVRIADNLSGLDTWTATLDGQWIMMEYEPKDRTLRHTFDPHSEGRGRREFKLVATDERKNETVYTYTFLR